MSGRYNQAFYLSPSADGVTPTPGVIYDGSVALAAAMTTAPVWVKDVDAYSIQFSVPAGSTLVGNIVLQASNDRGNREQTGVGDATMINWTNIVVTDKSTAGALIASKAVVSGGPQALMLADLNCVYRWVRLAFSFTSGTGLARISMQHKGWP